MKLKPSFSILVAVSLAIGLVISSCASGSPNAKDYSGTFIGYAWKDEAKGVILENASEKVQTTLVLDRKGVIKEASVDFLILKNGEWISRLADAESVSVDFSVSPVAAVADPYKAGVSMFKVKANDFMSLYAVSVANDGTVAGFIVDPMTRYQFEFKFLPGFDFNLPVSSLTIDSGLFVPTVRTSSGGLIKPKSWTTLAGQSIFDFSPYSHVLNLRGAFDGLSSNSTVTELLTAMGVLFDGPKAKPLAPVFGYTGQGGWAGNYAAIADYLVGKNARDLTSLIDWSNTRYSGAINGDNFFGLSAVAGATTTVQDSYSTISGATVRVSRESSSYQRALVAAGILDETQVIKGRF